MGEPCRGFDAHRRAQARRGLRMSPAERLRWLERTMSTLSRWKGKARKAPPLKPDGATD